MFSRNREIFYLFLVGFGLRLFLVLTAGGIATDGCSYLWLAQDIAKGDFQSGINAYLPPLFPILSAAVSFIFRDFELSGRMISCLAGSLTVLPLFFLIKDIFNRKIAVVTVIFFIIHPYLLRASGEVLTEATHFFLITSLAWVLWMAIRSRKAVPFLLVGFLAGLTYLARPEGVAVIFLVLGWVWLTNLSKTKNGFRWKLTASLFFVVIYILILSPFHLHFHDNTGSWKPTTRHVAFVDDKGADESWPQVVARVMKWKVCSNVPYLFYAVPKAYYPVFLILLFFGLIKRENLKGFRAGEGYILSFIVLRILVITIFAGVTDRYFYAFVPMALCWAGAGFWEINHHLLKKYNGGEWRVGGEKISRISMAMLLVIGALCLPKGLEPVRAHRAIQRKAGYWLRENAGKDEFTVAANSPQEAFHAGAKFYELTKGTYQEVLNQARQAKADFIIVDKNIDSICPGFAGMVKKEHLEVFSTEFEASDRRIIIYKLRG